MLESFRYGKVEITPDEGGWDPGNYQIIEKHVEKAKLNTKVWKEFSHSVLSAHKLPCFEMSLSPHNPISFCL